MSTSPSGYAMETAFSSPVRPGSWTYGLIRKIHDSNPTPDVRMNVSSRLARSRCGAPDRARLSRPVASSGKSIRYSTSASDGNGSTSPRTSVSTL